MAFFAICPGSRTTLYNMPCHVVSTGRRYPTRRLSEAHTAAFINFFYIEKKILHML